MPLASARSLQCWVSWKSEDLTGTRLLCIVNKHTVKEEMLKCKGTQFLLSQMARDLELVGNVRALHMHSYGALVEDVWLSDALSIYSVPIDLTFPRTTGQGNFRYQRNFGHASSIARASNGKTKTKQPPQLVASTLWILLVAYAAANDSTD